VTVGLRTTATLRCVVSRRESRGGRWLALLLTLVIVAISGCAAFVGTLYGFGLKCDESCSKIGGSWSVERDAWQWDALGWCSVGVFGCALLFFAALIARRRVLAQVTAGGWVALGIAFLVLWNGAGI
jgi:hypothetical protein